jgi:hypothetical protein
MEARPPPLDNTPVGDEQFSDSESDVPEEACETTGTSELCISNQVYVDSGNDKKVLYLLCLGLTDNNSGDGTPLFSLDNEPWALLPKQSLRPKNTDYAREISRRAHLYNISPAPRPSNWTRVQILEWFAHYPVREEEDVNFLRSEVLRLREVLVRVQEQERQERRNNIVNTPVNGGRGVNRTRGRNWRGVVPYLRIIMCLTEDNVKSLYLTRADTRSRQELDARNSDTR